MSWYGLGHREWGAFARGQARRLVNPGVSIHARAHRLDSEIDAHTAGVVHVAARDRQAPRPASKLLPKTVKVVGRGGEGGEGGAATNHASSDAPALKKARTPSDELPTRKQSGTAGQPASESIPDAKQKEEGEDEEQQGGLLQGLLGAYSSDDEEEEEEQKGNGQGVTPAAASLLPSASELLADLIVPPGGTGAPGAGLLSHEKVAAAGGDGSESSSGSDAESD